MPSDFTREDYEHAARAAGLTIRWLSGKAWLHTESGVIPWAPPDDDGDTFRLMVAAKAEAEFTSTFVNGGTADPAFESWVLATEHYNGNPRRATRYAIFRAAIEIGKSMKGTP